ncbi:hypothetical protein [Magnetospirillum molischianum]|uniref:Uncharacterized protein n=1 Tax=Magnetospirillum molischianum DSM 120 TaxID=1150626 RepID=H8FY05_MAGML|nr:hypothetical protein [Magnetospirillum molischianum]CCG43243.1 hypothetical protein PHAMO_80034 [Magnetospirillum molischianum DSM 120]
MTNLSEYQTTKTLINAFMKPGEPTLGELARMSDHDRAMAIRRSLESAGIEVKNWPRKETTAAVNEHWGTW